MSLPPFTGSSQALRVRTLVQAGREGPHLKSVLPTLVGEARPTTKHPVIVEKSKQNNTRMLQTET